jgi:hypothetical protein
VLNTNQFAHSKGKITNREVLQNQTSELIKSFKLMWQWFFNLKNAILFHLFAIHGLPHQFENFFFLFV